MSSMTRTIEGEVLVHHLPQDELIIDRERPRIVKPHWSHRRAAQQKPA